MVEPRFNVSGWFLIVATFAIGWACGRYNGVIESLLWNLMSWCGGGVPC